MRNILEKIKEKLKGKPKISTPPVPIDVKIPEFVDVFEPVPEIDEVPPTERVIIRQKKRVEVVEEEPEPAEDEAVYVCETCPSDRLHTRDQIFPCQYCGKWFCEKHLSWHIHKNHKEPDYQVVSNGEGGATYILKR